MAEYKDMNELFQYWENNKAYPEYVCGVWSTNGSLSHLTVAVNDKNAEAEILLLIENDSSVAFAYQKYSKNYLLSVIDEMNDRFSESEYAEKIGFVSMGLNEYDNRVDISFKEEFENDESSLELVNELRSRFGDAVSIEYTDEVIWCTDDLVAQLPDGKPISVVYSPVASIAPEPPTEKSISALEDNLAGVCIILAVSILILVTAFVLQQKKLLSFAHGGAGKASYSKEDVENIIKNNTPDTSAELDLKIMTIIDTKDV